LKLLFKSCYKCEHLLHYKPKRKRGAWLAQYCSSASSSRYSFTHLEILSADCCSSWGEW
jgi:hypothetical protein